MIGFIPFIRSIHSFKTWRLFEIVSSDFKIGQSKKVVVVRKYVGQRYSTKVHVGYCTGTYLDTKFLKSESVGLGVRCRSVSAWDARGFGLIAKQQNKITSHTKIS